MRRLQLAVLLLALCVNVRPHALQTGVSEKRGEQLLNEDRNRFTVVLTSTGEYITTTAFNVTEDAWEVKYEAEKQKVDSTQNAVVSLMLLVSISFMMSIFYLVNHSDKDIMLVAWQVISSTISIFASVLIFQAINSCISTYLLAGATENMVVLAGLAHMLVWILTLQFVLAWNCGAVHDRSEIVAIEEEKERKRAAMRDAEHKYQGNDQIINEAKKMIQQNFKESTRDHYMSLELDTKCWATLGGHISGFAAINAFGNIQQALKHSLPISSAVVLVALVVLVTLGMVFTGLRYLIHKGDAMMEEELQAYRPDDAEDLSEWRELWEDEAEETENEIIALAVSFLLVQVLRMLLVGHLPDVEGEDWSGATITNLCALGLLGCGVLAAILQILKALFVKRGAESRISAWYRDIMAMTMAWCILFSCEWFLKIRMSLSEDSALLSVTIAVATSFLAIALIFVLDWLADQDWTDENVDQSLRAFITAFGILIGFAWERSFDTAVTGVAGDGVLPFPPPVAKLVMAVVLAMIVVPAWKWYILKSALKAEEEEKELEEEAVEQGFMREEDAPKDHKLQFKHAVGLTKEMLAKKREEAYVKRITELEDALRAVGQAPSLPYVGSPSAYMGAPLQGLPVRVEERPVALPPEVPRQVAYPPQYQQLLQPSGAVARNISAASAGTAISAPWQPSPIGSAVGGSPTGRGQPTPFFSGRQ